MLDALHQRGELATRDVMALLGVDRQTAMRDLRSLREAGLPLVPVGHGAQRRYRLESAFRRSRARISVGDVLSLHFGRNLIAFLQRSSEADWLEDLREKLAPAFAGESDALAQRLAYVPEPVGEIDQKIFDELLRAVMENREVRVEGHDRLQPLAIVIYRQWLYLMANHPGTGTLLKLRIEELKGPVEVGNIFRYPKRFDLHAELDRVFGVEADREPEPVVLRFSPRLAAMMRRRRFHASQQWVDLPDGGVELRMATCGEALRSLVLELGDGVEVVEPSWLREDVATRLAAALEHYRPHA